MHAESASCEIAARGGTIRRKRFGAPGVEGRFLPAIAEWEVCDTDAKDASTSTSAATRQGASDKALPLRFTDIEPDDDGGLTALIQLGRKMPKKLMPRYAQTDAEGLDASILAEGWDVSQIARSVELDEDGSPYEPCVPVRQPVLLHLALQIEARGVVESFFGNDAALHRKCPLLASMGVVACQDTVHSLNRQGGLLSPFRQTKNFMICEL
ncbi:hypothetical protein AK812_SmicGene39965 [Symbiodinium microadriaticum]|uniref:Uncharacterized protein n=1 Tax=Symbiodinium microadriaticum TaxID=2951 RepID=A0A1Q9CA68_SYMMI|nr:hypothetical protein AK812_SmicGene39965 [Symbiodinium microadriaticum]